jgi:hypothetical protein
MLLIDSGRFAYQVGGWVGALSYMLTDAGGLGTGTDCGPMQGTDLSATLHREYAAYTRAHNTWTIDGCDQLPLPGAIRSEG